MLSSMTETPVEQATQPCECGCGQNVTPGLVFGKPRRYIRGHGPQAKGKQAPSGGTKPEPPASFGTSPSLDELKASKDDREEDRAPGKVKRGKRGKEPRQAPEVPPFRAGPIAAGMNKLYLRAGKLVRVMDPDIGTAIIETTRKETDDDVTVGEAWEELAKTNPRIRAFLLKLISGGAYGQLLMAHLPIVLAILMKDAIRKRLPFQRIMDAMLVDRDEATGEEAPSDIAAMMGNLSPADVQQMMGMAQAMMGGINLDGMTSRNGTQRAPAPAETDGEAA